MKKNKITIAKEIKRPIPGVQFSNKCVRVEVEFDSEGFNDKLARDEINQLLNTFQEDDPTWIAADEKKQEDNKLPF